MKRARQGGFTLIELLVGLTLLGLIVVAVTGGLRLGIAGAGRVTERAAALDELRGAQSFLRTRIEAARPVRWQDDAGSPLAFEGRAASLSFVSDLPAYPDIGGLYKLKVERRDGNLVLVRQLTEGREAGFALRDGDMDIVARQVSDVRFSYFGVQRGDREARWHDDWRADVALPSLIRIRISARGRAWPDILVAPRLGEQPR